MATEQEKEAFFNAVKLNQVDKVKELLEAKPDLIHAKDGYEYTALHHAADTGSTEIIQILLEKNSTAEFINAQNRSGNTALHYATIRNNIEITNILVQHSAKKKISNESVKEIMPRDANELREVSDLSNTQDSAPSSVNPAILLFKGDGTSKSPSHLDFSTWYHPDIWHYLLQISPNQAQCLPVIFVDASDDDNTKTFKSQLQTLIVLAIRLNKPAIFISKEPGASIHFICGLVMANNLLLINPLGVTKHTVVYKTLGELQQENTLNNVWLSSTVLQKEEYEKNGLVSCGPISLELAVHILNHFTLAQLYQFWENLKTNEPITHNTSSLKYFSISIDTLLSKNLQQLSRAANETDYKAQVKIIRQQHGEALETLAVHRAKAAHTTVEAYLAACKESAPAQVVYQALLMQHRSAGNIDELPEYVSLETALSTPDSIINSEKIEQQKPVISDTQQASKTEVTNPDEPSAKQRRELPAEPAVEIPAKHDRLKIGLMATGGLFSALLTGVGIAALVLTLLGISFLPFAPITMLIGAAVITAVGSIGLGLTAGTAIVYHKNRTDDYIELKASSDTAVNSAISATQGLGGKKEVTRSATPGQLPTVHPNPIGAVDSRASSATTTTPSKAPTDQPAV